MEIPRLAGGLLDEIARNWMAGDNNNEVND
jgi:hypothetical protein